jgi:hypothetical protein
MWYKILYKCNLVSIYGVYLDIKISQKKYLRIRFW